MRLYDPAGYDLNPGDYVLVKSDRGLELGRVARGVHEISPDILPVPLKPIVRKATEDDLGRDRANRAKAARAVETAQAKAKEHGLPIKILRARCTFDGQRLVFDFASRGRVDFRSLARDLASALRARVELHQVGARDVAKLMSGAGRCGRALCCGSWLAEFESVTMKMAKDQGMSLVPEKLSGACGRLRCCLRYEHEGYVVAKSLLPKIGRVVETENGPGKVIEHRIPKGTYVVALEEGGHAEVPSPHLGWAFGCGSECGADCASDADSRSEAATRGEAESAPEVGKRHRAEGTEQRARGKR
jgi:cell fate regulator YaaT (PSP1 superfamily)